MAEVFADDFRCSMPSESWDAISAELEGVAADAGFLLDFERGQTRQLRLDGATIKREAVSGLRVVSCSGQALARLRAVKLLGQFLAVIGQEPHRVTGLHATMDVREATPPVITRLLAKAESEGGLRAGRKRIPVQAIERHLKRLGDGSDTGSIYCGGKLAEIRPVVYDKRQERLFRGLPDIGYDLTRWELRLRSGVGATLRDVMDPAPIFWHYMAPDFLDRPAGVPEWSAEAEGFVFHRPAPPLPAARLLRAADGSVQLRELVKLAGTFPGGIDFLCHIVRRLDHGALDGVQGLAPAVTALGAEGAAIGSASLN